MSIRSKEELARLRELDQLEVDRVIDHALLVLQDLENKPKGSEGLIDLYSERQKRINQGSLSLKGAERLTPCEETELDLYQQKLKRRQQR